MTRPHTSWAGLGWADIGFWLKEESHCNIVLNKCAAPWENQQSALAKTKTQISFAVTTKLISAYVFATRIVQFLFYLNPKFQASSCFLCCLYRPVCVRPVRKPHCWFSHEAAQIMKKKEERKQRRLYSEILKKSNKIRVCCLTYGGFIVEI